MRVCMDILGYVKVMILSITKLDSHNHNEVYVQLMGLANINQDINSYDLLLRVVICRTIDMRFICLSFYLYNIYNIYNV